MLCDFCGTRKVDYIWGLGKICKQCVCIQKLNGINLEKKDLLSPEVFSLGTCSCSGCRDLREEIKNEMRDM